MKRLHSVRCRTMPPTPLDYDTDRPPLRRRVWRRVRLPLTVVALLAAVLLTPAIWRRADEYLIEREVSRWTRWRDAAKAHSRLVQSVEATPERVAPLRALVGEFEPRLPDALNHRSQRVRSHAAEAIGAALSELSPSVRRPPLKPPLFTDATRRLCYERYLSDFSDVRASLYLWDAMATAADRPVDLRLAIKAWPNLPQVRRTMLVRLVQVLGPQTPHAGEFLLLVDPPPRARTWCQLDGLLTIWFPLDGRLPCDGRRCSGTAIALATPRRRRVVRRGDGGAAFRRVYHPVGPSHPLGGRGAGLFRAAGRIRGSREAAGPRRDRRRGVRL